MLPWSCQAPLTLIFLPPLPHRPLIHFSLKDSLESFPKVTLLKANSIFICKIVFLFHLWKSVYQTEFLTTDKNKTKIPPEKHNTQMNTKLSYTFMIFISTPPCLTLLICWNEIIAINISFFSIEKCQQFGSWMSHRGHIPIGTCTGLSTLGN